MSEAPKPAEPAAAAAPAAAAPAKSKLTLVVLALSVVNLGGTGFVAMRSMKPVVVQVEQKEESHGGHGDEEGPTAPLDAFVVNLNEPGSTRYLKTSLELQLANAKVVEELARQKPAIRDELLRYLSSLSVEQTQGEESKAKMQSEMMARVDRVMGAGRVKKLFFNEFVVQ